MTTQDELLAFTAEHFVSLTTFRKSGVPVSTPVWIVRDGDTALITTPEGTGKLKRLANDPRVELRPSTRMGKVADDAPVALATAEVIEDQSLRARNVELIKQKHRVEYAIFTFIENRFRKAGSRNFTIRLTARDA